MHLRTARVLASRSSLKSAHSLEAMGRTRCVASAQKDAWGFCDAQDLKRQKSIQAILMEPQLMQHRGGLCGAALGLACAVATALCSRKLHS